MSDNRWQLAALTIMAIVLIARRRPRRQTAHGIVALAWVAGGILTIDAVPGWWLAPAIVVWIGALFAWIFVPVAPRPPARDLTPPWPRPQG